MSNLEEKAIHIASLDSLLGQQFPVARWTIQHIIPEGGVTILSAAPGSFKTWIMLEMALSVAEGRKLFDTYECSQTGVLFVDEESGPRMLQERFIQLGSTLGLSVHYTSRQNTKVTQEFVNQLVETCEENGIGLVMFDSLVRLHSGDENTSKDMAGLFELFRQMADNGLSVLIAHHNRKAIVGSFNPAGDMRGSSDILASVDCHMALSRQNGGDYVTIQQTKNRYMRELRPFKLRFTDGSFEFSGEVKSRTDKQNDLKNAIITGIQGKSNFTKKALYEQLNANGNEVGMNRLGDLLEELMSDGLVFPTPGPRNATYYSLEPNNGSALKTQ